MRDVAGLYLDPPEGEVVVSVDVKSGIQALDRTQPLLQTEKRTHDYVRAGTIDLYAAIDVRTGKVIASLSPPHATPDFRGGPQARAWLEVGSDHPYMNRARAMSRVLATMR